MSPQSAYDRYGHLIYRYCVAAAGIGSAAEITEEVFSQATGSLSLDEEQEDPAEAILLWRVLMERAMQLCRTRRPHGYTPPHPVLSPRQSIPRTVSTIPYSYHQVREAFLSLSEEEQSMLWRLFLGTEDEQDAGAAHEAAGRLSVALTLGGIPDSLELE